ncbi:MAG TPA: metallophosphoesterase family protein [Tepidisphaeraceae bacterium]|jgi:serine/threonine protein phosphatase 1
MRLLAIGDIHGCSRAMDALLDVALPASDDVIVALGDFVDWGPDSRGVLDRLLSLRSRCNLIALRGNHEEMMLRSRLNADEHAIWLRAGGDVTLRCYADRSIPESHWNFIEHECRDFYETDSHIFVHGGLSSDVPLQEQPAYMLRWKTFRDVRPHCSGKVVVCGHTTQRDGEPRWLGHSICIDTGASCGGWLTCLEPATGAYWQANQGGKTRRGELA